MSRNEFVSGVLFTAVAKYSSIIVSLVVVAILSRLLSPEDFGVITIATVILSFFAIFSDLGIAPAIVQNKDLTKNDLNQIFTLTIYLGLFVSLFFFAISPLVTKFYNVETLLNICKLLSINLLFSALNIVPNAILLKAKRFKFIAVRTVLVQAIIGAIAVVAALSGFGIYSLLITPIGSSIVIFIINYLQNPLFLKLKIQRESIRKISSYSTYQFLFSVINYFSRNIDNLLIGRYIGVVALGFYDKSYRLMMLPLSNVAHVVTPVMHPIFSEHQQDREYIFNAYLKLLNILSYVGFPLSVFLYFEASNLIVVVFGNQWVESVPVFEILAISVAPQLLTSTLGSIFQSTNETKKLFVLGNINTTINIVAIVSAIIFFRNILSVSIFVSGAFYLNLLVSFSFLFRTVFLKSPLLLARRLVNPTILSVCLIPACYYIRNLSVVPVLSIAITSLTVLVLTLIFLQISREYDVAGLLKKYIK